MDQQKQIFDGVLVFFTDVSTDARTLNMARTFAKSGKKIAVIAQGDENTSEMLKHESLSFFPINISNNSRFWFKWLQFLIKGMKYRHLLHAKYVFAMDFYSLFLSFIFASRFKAGLFYDSREIYSALGPLSSNKIKQMIITRMEKWLVKKVQAVIVSGELDKNYLKNNLRSDIPYHVIMNLPPFRDAVKNNFLRQKFSIQNDMIIMLYQGMLLPGRGILQAVNSLLFNEKLFLVIYGEGYYKSEIEKEIRKLNLEDRVVLAGTVKYDELHQISCSADIGLVLIEPISLSYQLALPNKLFEYCMAGIPSLTSNLPAIISIINENEIGKFINFCSEPEHIASSATEIFSNSDYYREKCRIASKKFNYESQQELILKILDQK